MRIRKYAKEENGIKLGDIQDFLLVWEFGQLY